MATYTDRMNFIWGREPQEALDHPYEYTAQEQYLREAEQLLSSIFDHLMKTNRSFTRDEISVKKAVWMLCVDACDTLRDCVDLLVKKKHRTASRSFRDIIETLDLALYFYSEAHSNSKHLVDWFNDEIVPHRVYREWVGTKNSQEKQYIRDQYIAISKFTHRSYRALAHSYSLGHNDILSYEGEFASISIPHPISLGCSIHSNYLLFFCTRVVKCQLISQTEMDLLFEKAIEKEPASRQFEVYYSGAKRSLELFLEPEQAKNNLNESNV